MKDLVRVSLLALGVTLILGGWGLQHLATQDRIALGSEAATAWFSRSTVLAVKNGKSPLRRRFEAGIALVALGVGLLVVAIRYPRSPASS